MGNIKGIGENKLKKKLTPEQYSVCVLKGTEPAFSGKYLSNKKKGVYVCAVCDTPLFSSETKYDSGSGWPSFWDYAVKENIQTEHDNSLGVPRTEVLCANCGSHLGHVFSDRPEPSGLRYCINSLSLNFVPEGK